MKKLSIIPIFCLLLMQACSNKSNHENIVLLSDSIHRASCVSFTSDETGAPVISWAETDKDEHKFFFFSYLNKKDNSFPDRIAVPVEQSSNLHEEGMPKIAIKADGTIVAVYETAAPTEQNKFAGFVKYIQSFDKGKNWTSPLFVHADTTGGKGHSFAAITRLSNGEIGASWLDVSFGDSKTGRSVKFSTTNGRSGFSGETVVDSLACQCCRTAISCDVKGNISIMFRDIISDSVRDMSVCNSTNNGKTFTKATSFTNDGWVINGCPHNGPSVVNEAGKTYAAWFTGGSRSGVYYASLDNDNQVVDRKKISDKSRNIQLCLLPGDTKIVAYNENVYVKDSFYSKIAVNKIAANGEWTMDITTEPPHAGYPVLQILDSSNVVVAWEDNNKIYYRMVNINDISSPVKEIKEHYSTTDTKAGLQKLSMNKDLVCGMPVSVVEDTVHFNGKVYGFCSADCKSAFVKRPELYLPVK